MEAKSGAACGAGSNIRGTPRQREGWHVQVLISLVASFAQFIRICRWLQLIHRDRLAPLENAPFSTLWTRKRYRVAQRFRQYLRATNCYKLSDAHRRYRPG